MTRPKTTAAKANLYNDLMPLLEAMLKEFQDQSKKKPEAILSASKIKVVNRLLKDIFAIIEGESTRSYLDLLDEDSLPQNSDVALMLGQVAAAMHAFKNRYYYYNNTTYSEMWSL